MHDNPFFQMKLFFLLPLLVSPFQVLISSQDCKKQCLDLKNKIYCPTRDLKMGYCCDVAEACPREFKYCSSNFTTASSSIMQQFICPFDSYCGTNSYNLTAGINSTQLVVSNKTTSQ